MSRKPNLIARRAAFVMADSMHRVHVYNARVSIRRAGEDEHGLPRYEGDTTKRLLELHKLKYIPLDYDLVGVLVASDEAATRDALVWVDNTGDEVPTYIPPMNREDE